MFLYPKESSEYPFDNVCRNIVRKLEECQWKKPGISVKFFEYKGYKMVSEIRHISGNLLTPEAHWQYDFDFRLEFNRYQGSIDSDTNDIAAVGIIGLPRKELHVYRDKSLVYLLYVGNNWARDRLEFFNRFKCNSRSKGEAKTYLRYEGCCDCNQDHLYHRHTNTISPLLLYNTDLGREYAPEGNEPQSFSTQDVFEEFRHGLESVYKTLY